MHRLVLSLPSRSQTLAIAVKKHAKTDTKLFFSYPFLLDLSILFQIFCPVMQKEFCQHLVETEKKAKEVLIENMSYKHNYTIMTSFQNNEFRQANRIGQGEDWGQNMVFQNKKTKAETSLKRSDPELIPLRNNKKLILGHSKSSSGRLFKTFS